MSLWWQCQVGSEADADSIQALGADEARDAVSDTKSGGRDSDLRSVVSCKASSEPADDPGIRQAANTRGFSFRLVQLDGFHVTEIVKGWDLIRQERAWKLLFLLPRILLCRPCRGGHVPKKELEQKGWQCSILEIGRSGFAQRMSEKASQNLVPKGSLHNSDT